MSKYRVFSLFACIGTRKTPDLDTFQAVYFAPFSKVFIANFEQVNVIWALADEILLRYQVTNQLPIQVNLHKE